MSFPEKNSQSNKVTEKEIENNKNDQVTEKEKQLAKNEVEILEEEEKEKEKETEKEKQKEKEKEQTKEDHNKKNVTNREQKKTTYQKKEYPKPKGVRNMFFLFGLTTLTNLLLAFIYPQNYQYLKQFTFGFDLIPSLFEGVHYFLFFIAISTILAIFSYYPRNLYESLNLKRSIFKTFYGFVIGLHFTLIVISLYFPLNPVLAGALTLYMIIYILKIHSWYFTADKLEENLKSNPNAKFSNYLYFLLAPTLIYKNNFEKKEKRRKIYICYKFVSFILGLLGIWLVYLNYLEPIFIESTNYFFWMLPLDTVRLIIPIQLIWWGIFMTFFRAMLKLTAELLKWKDNRFYDDWWNAHNVREFWKKWNVMFHKFASHHIFKFLLQNSNVSVTISFGAVFIVSGILHEILICSAFRVFSFQWFLSFIIQIFLVIGQSKLPIGLRNGNGGNLIFWSTLFFGLPGLALWYRRLLLLKTVTNGAI